jgi:hypothetical protein
MNKRILFASYKSLLALLILVAVITQIINLVGFGVFNPANFFSFFTIESNLFIAVIFALSAWGYWRNRPVKCVTSLRGAAALYMVTTGLVYITLLTGLQESLNTNIPWVNFVLHYFVPAVALLDWLIDRPAGARHSYKAVLLWLIFPIVWLVYSIVRGVMVGWYAYPFLDPHTGGGLSEVIIVCVGISILMGGLGALLVWFGSFRFHKK